MIMQSEEAVAREALHARVATFHSKAKTIVLAVAISILVLTAVGFWLAGVRTLARMGQMPVSFVVGVIFLALGATAIRRTQLRWLRLQAVGTLRGVEGVLKHLLRMTVIVAALAEAIGVLALLVGIFAGEQFYVLIFGLVAMVVLLSSYPRLLAWERAAQYFASAEQK
ncbi:MAG TPA: hypothetical protein VF131_12800 [Blastocatellia bacterium]|nr:hypothetical protein [Blastocatellia bacterium]